MPNTSWEISVKRRDYLKMAGLGMAAVDKANQAAAGTVEKGKETGGSLKSGRYRAANPPL